jgi:hypothetical protein
MSLRKLWDASPSLRPCAEPVVVDRGEGASALVFGGITKPLGSVPLVARVAGKAASALDGKLVYDGATYLGAEAVCAAGGG